MSMSKKSKVRFAWAILCLQLLVPALVVARSISRQVPEASQTDPGVQVLRIGDYFHFWSAGKAMLSGGDIFSVQHGQNYIYPPLVAWLFQPLAMLDQRPGVYIWLAMSVFILGAGVVILTRELARRMHLPGGWHTVLVACVVSLACLIDKVQGEFKLQQTDGVMLLCMALALKWLDKRPILAGLALGFAGNIKYLSLIPLPWFVVRGRWIACVSTLLSFIGFLFLPAVTHGWERNLSDLKVAFAALIEAFGINVEHLTRATSNPITWERSVSITSMFFRLAEKLSLGPGTAVALIGLVAAGCLVTGWVLYARQRLCFWSIKPKQQAVVGYEWVALTVAALIFGPQTTNRHLIMLLPLFLLASLLLVRPKIQPAHIAATPDTWSIILAGIAVVLALVLPPGNAGNYAAVNAWRAVGGVSWISLVFLFVTLGQGLKYQQTVPAPSLPSL